MPLRLTQIFQLSSTLLARSTQIRPWSAMVPDTFVLGVI